MWHYVRAKFDAANVTNAVWAMDYSVSATQPEYHPLIASLWPGDGYVDWLLFNVFKFSKQKTYSFEEVVNQSSVSYTHLTLPTTPYV